MRVIPRDDHNALMIKPFGRSLSLSSMRLRMQWADTGQFFLGIPSSLSIIVHPRKDASSAFLCEYDSWSSHLVLSALLISSQGTNHQGKPMLTGN